MLIFDKIKSRDFSSREFEREVTVIANNLTTDEANSIQQILYFSQKELDADQKFIYFYVLSIHFRTLLEFDEGEKLVKYFSDEFSGKYKIFKHIESMIILERIKNGHHDSTNIDMFKKYLRVARKNIDDLPNHSGVVHVFCDLFATIFEYLYFYNPEHVTILEEYYDSAIDLVTDIIQNESYAKFYDTCARIRAYKGDYKEALKSVALAIKYENPKGKNYALKIMNYKTTKNFVASLQAIKETQEKTTKVVTEAINSSTWRSIEVIAFFAGLLGFIVTSIQISTSFVADDVAFLILLLLGGNICVYGTFSLIINRFNKKDLVKQLIAISIGVVLMIISLILVLVL